MCTKCAHERLNLFPRWLNLCCCLASKATIWCCEGRVTSKFTTLLLQFQILCIPPTCKVINEILEFGSWWVGALAWQGRACIIYQAHTVKCAAWIKPGRGDGQVFKKLQNLQNTAENCSKQTHSNFEKWGQGNVIKHLTTHCVRQHFRPSIYELRRPTSLGLYFSQSQG